MKAIASIAMCYNIEEFLAFMKDIGDILDDAGVWVLELSYLPSMFKHGAYDTICHEHLGCYCLSQIKWMAALACLKLLMLNLMI